MAVTAVRIRRRLAGGAAGAPSSLKTAELAWNMQDGKIYGGFGDDGGGNATSIKVLGMQDFVDPAGTYQPIDADLTALAGLDATAGILVKTAANTYVRRTLTGTATRILVSNGDGAAGVPTIDLATVSVGTSTGGGSTKFTVDGYGRVTNASQASLTDISAPTGTWSAGANLLQSSATPAGGNDLTNKTYVDQAIAAANLAADPKDSVRLASTAQQALSGGTAFPTIDGVVTAAGNRVLLRMQTAQAENGIYVVGGTAAAWTLTRATDFDSWAEIPGASVVVEEGSTYADSLWISSANAGGTLGTTAITWLRADAGAGGGFTTAGAGLSSAGATIDVVAGTGITTASDTVALAGQALALHNVATSADKLIYATGTSTFGTTDFTAVARTLLAQTSQALMRSTGLGLGSMATQDASNVAITGGTIDGVTIDGGTF